MSYVMNNGLKSRHYFPAYRTDGPTRHDNRTMFSALLYIPWQDSGLLEQLFIALSNNST
jgi:hypothetical protein